FAFTWLLLLFSVAPEAVAAPYVLGSGHSSALVGWWLVTLPLGIIIGDLLGGWLLTAKQQTPLIVPSAALCFRPCLAVLPPPPLPQPPAPRPGPASSRRFRARLRVLPWPRPAHPRPRAATPVRADNGDQHRRAHDHPRDRLRSRRSPRRDLQPRARHRHR